MMARVTRDERGFALAELLIASVLMILVMGTAFTALKSFEDTSGRNTRQNDAQDAARNAMDLMVRLLRNDASPTPGSPQAIERASGTDLIFQTVDPNALAAGSQNLHNIMRVRYCLDDSTTDNEKLWTQVQNWTSPTPPARPSSVSCPDPAWGNSRQIVDHVVNDFGQTRALWTIDCPQGFSASTCTDGTDPAMLASVKRLAITMWVDDDPTRLPAETRLSTGIFLRNQNARPVASLVSPPNVAAGHIYPNASPSSDPDADRMFFRWCYFGVGVTPSSTWCANGTEIQQHTVAIDYVPSPAPHGTVTIGVRVEDQGGLVSYSYQQVPMP